MVSDREASVLSSVLPLKTHLGFNLPRVWKVWSRGKTSVFHCSHGVASEKLFLGFLSLLPSVAPLPLHLASRLVVKIQMSDKKDVIHLKVELDEFIWMIAVQGGKLKRTTWGSSQVLMCSPGWLQLKLYAHAPAPYLCGVAGSCHILVP